MDVNEMSSASSSIGCLSDSVSSNMLKEEEEHLDDTASSSSSSSSNDSMFQLSDLMSQLPIKKGLSKYYNGKSDSFKNLISVRTLEDVPKNISQRNDLYKMKKKFKGSKQEKSYYYTTPKSKISKSNNNNGSIKGSVLMNTWSGRSSGLNSSTTKRFIRV